MSGSSAPLTELCDASVVRDGALVLDRIGLRIDAGQHSVILGQTAAANPASSS